MVIICGKDTLFLRAELLFLAVVLNAHAGQTNWTLEVKRARTWYRMPVVNVPSSCGEVATKEKFDWNGQNVYPIR